MSRKTIIFVFLSLLVLFTACKNREKSDILFHGKFSRIATISYSENGENYEVFVVPGQCVVFFSDTVSQPTAKEIIKAGGGKIIEQIPVFDYYLVKVREGEECGFVTYLSKKKEVEYAYFNTPFHLLSEVFILDDFKDVEQSMLTTHGNGVRKIFSKYSISDEVHSVNMLFLNDSDSSWRGRTTVSNAILSKLLEVAKNSTNEDLMLINMSFGTPLPGKNSFGDKYDDVDTNNQKLYLRWYAKELKQLAVCFDKMRAKGVSNFIVTKSSGNEGMHQMQAVFDLLDEKTINTLKNNMVLVCAHDDKDEQLYSNLPSNKHPFFTTVDISQELWCGTSFASPKLMGFVDKVHSNYEKLNAQQLLQAIRNATPEDSREPLTYEALEREAKKMQENYSNKKRYSFKLELTSDYNGEWNLSDGDMNEIVKYEVHNTYDYDYLTGIVKGLYLENKTNHNLDIYLNTIESEHDIRPMHYTLAAGEKDGFYAYHVGTMEILSVKVLEVQLSTW